MHHHKPNFASQSPVVDNISNGSSACNQGELSIMTDLSLAVSAALTKYYEDVAGKIHKWVDPLSDEAFWTKPYPYGNSVGHLVLHLTGNLQDRIAARISGSGYQRDRNREFTDSEKRPKNEVLANFDEAIAMVIDVIQQQHADNWLAPYRAATGPVASDRLSIVIRCLTHCNHHLGQIIYLTKELDRNADHQESTLKRLHELARDTPTVRSPPFRR
jgi:uncharacterized damage-inducible protein DinB